MKILATIINIGMTCSVLCSCTSNTEPPKNEVCQVVDENYCHDTWNQLCAENKETNGAYILVRGIRCNTEGFCQPKKLNDPKPSTP